MVRLLLLGPQWVPPKYSFLWVLAPFGGWICSGYHNKKFSLRSLKPEQWNHSPRAQGASGVRGQCPHLVVGGRYAAHTCKVMASWQEHIQGLSALDKRISTTEVSCRDASQEKNRGVGSRHEKITPNPYNICASRASLNTLPPSLRNGWSPYNWHRQCVKGVNTLRVVVFLGAVAGCRGETLITVAVGMSGKTMGLIFSLLAYEKPIRPTSASALGYKSTILWTA